MLTELAISKLSTPEKRKSFPAGGVPGLNLLLQPSGAKSWALQYRWQGIPRKLTIGSLPTVGLADARRMARAALGDVARGIDPAAAKKASRATARAAAEADEDKVERVVDMFIERHAKRKNRSWIETERMLRRYVAPWKVRSLRGILRANVNDRNDEICDSGRPIAANRQYAAFRAMCGWAVGRGLIEHNPCEGVKAPAAENRRDRVLGDDELKLTWQASGAVGIFGPPVRLLMLTGARLREVAEMEWRELDLEARLWTIPAARSKNKRVAVIPLTAAAVEIIAGLPRIDGSRFVFTTTRRSPVSGFSKAKTRLDAAIRALRGVDTEPMEPWVVHDIRRSVATNLQRLGVRLEVTEAVLNHVGGSRAGIVGVYQRHDWADEKRQALEVWSRRLHEIVTGEKAANVVDLATARAS